MAKRKNKAQSWWKKLCRRIFGAALVLWVLSLLISCLGYHVFDAGYNTASSRPVENWLGVYGAKSADLILTWWGVVLPMFLVAPLIWGCGFVRLREMVHPYWRLFAFAVGNVLGAASAALALGTFNGFNVGGNVGRFLSEQIMTLGRRIYEFPFDRQCYALLLALVALVSFNLACGITFAGWYKTFKAIFGAVAAMVVWLGKACSSLFGVIKKSSAGAPRKAKEPKVRREPKVQEEKTVPEKVKETIKIAKSKAIDDGYQFPSINLLSMNKEKGTAVNPKELERIAGELEGVLQEFGVNGKIVKVRPGPVVTLYELEPAPGTKTARVIGLADDIARSMSAVSVRIAVVPGSNTIGIELPNQKREIVYLRELLESADFKDSKSALTVTLGKDIGGKNVYADLAKMPHLLVAGTTGSGKSVGVNSMLISLLYKMRPEECKLILIDPKMLEFTMYNGIPHLLTPVITDPSKAVIGLKWAVKEMEDRYRAMAQLNVRNITGYNKRLEELRASGGKISRTVQTGFDMETGKPIYEEQELDLTPLPYIVIVVDEMADLMLVAGKDVEAAIQRLAQMARAAGIHLIMSTQRPSVDVITGTIKANFPTRISFQVTSKIDSRTILGEQGAEQLLGMGDMLYMPAGQRPNRIHAPFVKDSEVEQIVEFLKTQREPEYVESVTEGELSDKSGGSAVFDNSSFGSGSDDDLYRQAVQIVQNDKKVSTSYVQRRLRIGYNRAATIVERMEQEGIITAPDHTGRREVV